MLVWAVWCYPDTCLELLKVIWSWAVFPDEVDDDMGINPQDDDTQVELDELIDDETEEVEETGRGDDAEPAAEQELGKCCL